MPKDRVLWLAPCCGLPFLLFLLLFIVSVRNASKLVSGPETRQLYESMKHYTGKSFDAVVAQYGEPDETHFYNEGGIAYMSTYYRCTDGKIRFNGPVRQNIVEIVLPVALDY